MEASAAQPAGVPTEGAPQEPGQGAPAEAPGLYAEVLEGIPGEYHESLIEKLKGMDAQATKKFQSHAERVKPFEEAGVLDADPENLSSWMNLSNTLEQAVGGDEQAKQAVGQWWEQLGDELGFFQQEEGTGDEAQDLLDLTPQKLQEMVAEQTTQAINPLVERFEQQEQEKMLEEARQGINDDLAQLRKNNENLTDEDEKYILALAWQFGQDAEDPISVGFEEFNKLVNRGESNLFGAKVNQPAPAEGGGPANTQAPVPNSENAKELALERLKQLQAT